MTTESNRPGVEDHQELLGIPLSLSTDWSVTVKGVVTDSAHAGFPPLVKGVAFLGAIDCPSSNRRAEIAQPTNERGRQEEIDD